VVAGADQGDAFTRDMGYSMSEFLRILPTALAGYEHSIEDGRVDVSHPHGEQRLVLKIRPLPDRRLGMIRVPRVEVEFGFRNFSARQRREFLAGFDRSFQRGGG
jgi:hypothetical protein